MRKTRRMSTRHEKPMYKIEDALSGVPYACDIQKCVATRSTITLPRVRKTCDCCNLIARPVFSSSCPSAVDTV